MVDSTRTPEQPASIVTGEIPLTPHAPHNTAGGGDYVGLAILLTIIVATTIGVIRNEKAS